MFQVLGIALLMSLVGCDRVESSVGVAKVEAGWDEHFPVHVGKQIVQLRLAVTDLEKSQGLMRVEKLPESEGMAFMYATPQQMNFWMKDTLMDLDIAFVLDDGTIDEIRTMQAGDTRGTHSRSTQVRFTIEMPAGSFARAGVQTGDKVNLSDLKKALEARGFRPQRYLP